jgi:hypothetical protein
MSWVEKFGKSTHESIMDMRENDLPLVDVDYLRIGSAYARIDSENKDILIKLLQKFIEQTNLPFNPDDTINAIEIKELK